MAIAFRAVSSEKSINNDTVPLVVDRPTGVQQGDFMLAYFTVLQDQTTITPPTGWTLVHNAADTTNNPHTQMYVWSRVAGPSEPTTYTFSWDVSSGAVVGIVAYSGVDTTTPIATDEQAIDVDLTTSSTTHSTPSITTAGARWIVSAFADTSSSTWTGTDTERLDLARPGGAASLFIQDTNAAVDAGTYSKTGTASVSYRQNVRSIIALNPAVPQPSAGADQTVASGATVTLDGTDPDGATVSARAWTCTSAPSGVTPSITNSTSADATVTLATAGHYEFTYTTTVGGVDYTDTCLVYVTTANSRPENQVSNAGSWTGDAGDLADDSDATYIESVDSPTSAETVFRLQPLPEGQKTIKVRYASSDATTRTGVVELLNGPTGSAFASIVLDDVTTTVQEKTHDLTSGELAAITDLTNIHVRFTAS